MRRTLIDLTLYDPRDLPATTVATAPPCPAVYFVLDDNEEVVYVGQTANLANRFRDKKHPANRHPSVRWQVEADPDVRLRLETVYIAAHCPAENQAVMLRVSNGRLTEIRWKRAGRRRRP